MTDSPFEQTSVSVLDWGRIIFGSIIVFAFVVCLGVDVYLAFTANDQQWTRLKEVFQVIIPTITGTASAVIGFYFGNKSQG